MSYGVNLNEDEIEMCREAFERFDKDGSGSIDMWELQATLQAMGQTPSEEEIYQMISSVDDDGNGTIDFGEFLMVIENQKKKFSEESDDTEMVAAFVAVGGNNDKSGVVKVDLLIKVIKDFGLTIDIEQLIEETDKDHSGTVDYDEFRQMLCE
jgi:calmodulin